MGTAFSSNANANDVNRCALILIFVGAVAAWYAWQLQVYSLTLYFTMLVCGISAVLTGVTGIAYALLKLPI